MSPGVARPVAPDGFSIRLAVAEDLERLREIETAAGVVFADIEMASVSEDDPPSVAQLAEYQSDGRCWVAVSDSGAVVGYLIAEEVDGCCHIEQVSVHPDAAGHRLGRALIDQAEAWGVEHQMDALTLTTFVDVAWNGPYYERLGFRFLNPEVESPGLRAIRAAERAHGLDRWPRACMRRGGDPVPPRRMNC